MCRRRMSKTAFEDKYWEGHNQHPEARHKLALALSSNATSILDLGCGDGLFLSLHPALRKVGLEMSKEAVHKAKERGLDARQFDFEHEKLPFKDDEFDIVTLLDVLEHTFDPATELRNASLAGKRVVITVPNFAFLGARLSALFGRVPSVLNERKGHCFYFTRKKLQEIFVRANLRVVAEKNYYPLMNVPVVGLCSRAIGWIFPSLLATEFCFAGEKQ